MDGEREARYEADRDHGGEKGGEPMQGMQRDREQILVIVRDRRRDQQRHENLSLV